MNTARTIVILWLLRVLCVDLASKENDGSGKIVTLELELE
jgi:hypothetical protein